MFSSAKIPLIELPKDENSLNAVGAHLVDALRSSGFLLVKSRELDEDLQESAIQAASQLLIGNSKSSAVDGVIDHPTDPKLYLMLDSIKDIDSKCGESDKFAGEILAKYWMALERVKRQVLICLALGMKLEPDYFVKLHSKNRSALRLLHYPSSKVNNEGSTSGEPTIRCKPHSDYGTITLLLTDGVPGLEALIDDDWIPVPHCKGALVVNIGTLLQEWTSGKLQATLHRVIASVESAGLPRTSLAFFADPDPDVSAILKDPTETEQSGAIDTSVEDYIYWRAGREGRQRSGLAFSKEEEDRVNRARSS